MDLAPIVDRASPSPLTDLHERLAVRPDRRLCVAALDGGVVTRTFSEVHADVLALMSELRAVGIEPGDLVGILGTNCYEWVVADLALLGLGCVSVALPVPVPGRPAALDGLHERYQLAALLVTRSAAAGDRLPPATAVLEDRPLRLRRSCIGPGRRTLPPDVFSIAFSSGTSGTRKGLLMSRAGVVNTIETAGRAWRVGSGAHVDDDVLVVLPFSNFQQRFLVYLAVWFGVNATVVAPERMFQKMRVLEPTIVLGPPSFFEIVDNRVRAASLRDRLPYYLAASLHAVAPRASRGLRARLGRRWTGMYGSRVRLMLTGSAPVPPRMVTLFHRLGAPLFEVYGSTEVGWIAFNLPDRHRTGTAGRPVSGVEIEIGGDDEIRVATRCPQAVGYVFDGEESQDAVFLADGTIATGDVGGFDRSGFLRLVGRKNNVIITRSGVKINPEEIERDIETNCLIKKAVVVPSAENSSLSCAVWLPDRDSAERLREVEAYIRSSNATREPSHRIARVVFRPDTELAVETGLLTRNLKVDRAAVRRTVFSAGDRRAG
jgi:long-chain acyl-CoA synthetase